MAAFSGDRRLMPPGRLVVGAAALLLPLSLAVAVAWPLSASAVSGWSLSADPNVLPAGVVTKVTFHLADTAAGDDIGCVKIKLPRGSNVELQEATVTDRSPGIEWGAQIAGRGKNEVRAQAKTDADRLQPNQWVDIEVRVLPPTAGLSTWSAEAYYEVNCPRGGQILSRVSIGFTFTGGTPSPTPTKTPSPTPPPPSPAPTKTPSPTPTPTRPPSPTPTPKPTRTPTPEPTPHPTPAPTATPTRPPEVTETPSGPIPVPTPRPTSAPSPSQRESASPSATAAVITPPSPSAAPTSSGAGAGATGAGAVITDRWDYVYEMPTSLYEPGGAAPAGLDEGIEAVARLGTPVSWFVPALVTGVPGLLIVVIILAQVLLGVSWLPNVGRLLGPEPEVADENTHVWWAAGRPSSYSPAAQGEGWPSRIVGRFRRR